MSSQAPLNNAEIEDAFEKIQSGAVDDTHMVDLFLGADAKGRNFYAYLSIPVSKYMEYKALIASGAVLDPEDYGEVLEYGYEALPPAEVQEKMKAMGFEHDFETKLAEMMAKNT